MKTDKITLFLAFLRNNKAVITLAFGLLGNAGLSLSQFGEDIAASNGRWFIGRNGIIFVCSVLLLLLALFFDINKTFENQELKLTIQKLEEQVCNQLDPYAVSNVLIEALSNTLEFSFTERITVFKYSNTHSFFIPVARYAKNPEFSRKARTSYDINEGCIGRAWIQGDCDTGVLPSYENNLDEYKKACLELWGIPSEVVEKLKMKSRRYYGRVINSPGIPSTPVGVIVFETLNERFPRQRIGSTIGAAFTESSLNGILTWIVQQSPNAVLPE